MTVIKNFVSTFLTGLREIIGFVIIPAIFISALSIAYYFSVENILLGILLISVGIYGIYCMGKIKKEMDSWP